MKIKEVAETLERFAPLPLQEGYDNAGLQIGLTDADASGVLLCLDVTEEVIEEAASLGCNMVIAHHPLLFRSIKCISDATQVERCVRMAILNNITIYAAHTNLDNAYEGVNFEIAKRIGLQNIAFLQELPNGSGGSGVIGKLPSPEAPEDFLKRIQQIFKVACIKHNALPKRNVQRIAICGGAGESLLPTAVKNQADVFITGEMSYHRYFGWENKILIAELGHYQSEQFTISLMAKILKATHPELNVKESCINTNPIHYLC